MYELDGHSNQVIDMYILKNSHMHIYANRLSQHRTQPIHAVFVLFRYNSNTFYIRCWKQMKFELWLKWINFESYLFIFRCSLELCGVWEQRNRKFSFYISMCCIIYVIIALTIHFVLSNLKCFNANVIISILFAYSHFQFVQYICVLCSVQRTRLI